MIITVKGKEIELKQSIRALMIYENISGKTFEPKGLSDVISYMYCVVVASSGDYSLTFDEFIDEIDNNNDIVTKFTEWLTSTSSNQNKLKKTKSFY